MKLLGYSLIISLIFLVLIFSQHPSERQELSSLLTLPYINNEAEEPVFPLSLANLSTGINSSEFLMLNGHIIIDTEGNLISSFPGCQFSILIHEFIYTICKDKTSEEKLLKKLSINGSVLWEKKGNYTRGFSKTDRGTLLLMWKDSIIYHNRDVLFDAIIEIDENGTQINKWSTYDHMQELQKYYGYSPLDSNWNLKSLYVFSTQNNHSYDYFHLNSVKLIPKNKLGEKDDRFKEGNYLISMRHVNLICIIDKQSLMVVWCFGNNLFQGQHDPLVLESGNILVYDNGDNAVGESRNYSRILELDPAMKRIIWEYTSPDLFFSDFGGALEVRSNGNIVYVDTVGSKINEIDFSKNVLRSISLRQNGSDIYGYVWDIDLVNKNFIEGFESHMKQGNI